MPLNLNDLIKKAKDRGLKTTKSAVYSGQLIRPWQQESTLFEPSQKSQPNWKQTDNETENKQATKSEQIDSKPTTNRQPKVAAPGLTGNKLEAKPTTVSKTKPQQTDNKLITNTSFSSLVGLQRAIVFFVYNECKMARSKATESLTLEHISVSLQTSKGCIKTTIQRLESKGFIERVVFKNGRGGWSKYAITDSLFQELLQYETSNKLTTNWQQLDNKLETKPTTQVATSGPIVSSSYINTTTTLPDDLKQIDCSPLSEIGFDESHIIQIHREHMQKPEISLSADIIQNSINALAFDLKYNNAINDFKRPPAVVLTYLLKKGQPYSSKTPEKVTTPREEAMRQYLLAQERKNLKNLEIEVRAKELALQDWLSNLSENELSEFSHNYESCPPGMPEKIYQTSKRKKATASAKEYFDTVVWPDKRQQILYEGETIK